MNAITKEFSDAVEAQFTKLSTDVQRALECANVVQGIVADLEQRYDRVGMYAGEGAKSWGTQFIESEGLSEFVGQRNRPSRFRVDIKATVTTGDMSGGALGLPPQHDAVNMMPRRSLGIRSLLPTVSISTGSVEYPQQTIRTNNAAMVPETTAKPESSYGFTMKTVVPKVIAHWVPASRQILEDAPQLRDTIDSELLYGLALKEDEQLLSGDGAGENLEGLLTNATAYAPEAGIVATNLLDVLGLSILQCALADEPATGIVLHPADWMKIRLLKDGDGKYILGDPAQSVPSVLFGLPVVGTKSMTTGKFLTGNFQRAATLYDRWTPRVEVSTEHADFFTRNLVAILAEQRIALAQKNAAALVYGDLAVV